MVRRDSMNQLPLERAVKELMFDPTIRMFLTQRQSSSGSQSPNRPSNHLGSADALLGSRDDKRAHNLMKMVRELENSLEKANEALKMTAAEGTKVGQNGAKGGKGTRGKSGQVPPALVGMQTHLDNNQLLRRKMANVVRKGGTSAQALGAKKRTASVPT